MRENCTYGSEGGAAQAVPTPIEVPVAVSLVWQDGYHPQWVQGEYMLRNKLEYIHNNPVKRGWVDDPAHWRYSSYCNYHGMAGVLPLEPLL